MDLTGDSVTEDALVQGYTAHDAAGNAVGGTNPYEKAATDAEVLTQEQLLDEIVEELAKRCVVTEPLLQARTVTPTEEVQVVTPDAGYDGLSSVTVEAAQGGEGKYGWKKCVSKLPSGYTQVEYIQSDGTQYIDTGFKPNNNTRLTGDFEILANGSTYRTIFAAREGNLARCFSLFVSPTNTFYSNIGGKANVYTFSMSALGRHSFDVNKNVVTIDGTSYTHTAESFQHTTTTIYLCADNEDGVSALPCAMRWYSCQIYDNGTLVRDFIPCTNASGTAGLYDFVNGRFYGNAEGGMFTDGSSTKEPSATSVIGYVVSDDANAYPDGGFLDGYYYEKLAA